MKTAMFGGSFNPVHKGHVQLASAFIGQLSLDRVLIVPSLIPPHKQVHDRIDPQHRLKMCELAFEHSEKIQVCDIELRRQGASYTYETLQQLHEMYPQDELFLITGADMFMTIESWRHPEIIFSLATVCGVPRDSDSITQLQQHEDVLHSLGARTAVLDAGVMTVSSTEVRRRVRAGEDISPLVPAAVEEYIIGNGLYH